MYQTFRQKKVLILRVGTINIFNRNLIL